MVMHARKRPRINDGYFDQVDNHEKVDKYVDRSYGRKQYDRRGDREDYLFHQEKESPRLTRKLPYIDRLQPDKEKDKNDRHRRDTERFSYEERRSRSRDCSYNIQSKEHTDDGSSSESPSHSRRSRDRELLSRQDHSDDGSHEEDGSKSQTKEQRTEGQKVALRSCGDWSEHLSSSGKRYFYNCKTEVSQWVKPKEWTLDDSMKEKPGTVSNGKNLDTNYSHKTSKLISDSPRREYTKNTEDSIRHRSNHDRSSRELRDTRENNRSSKKQYDRNTEDSHSESSSPRSSTGDTRSPNHSESPGSVTNNGVIGGSSDDMDISPDASPRISTSSDNRSCDTAAQKPQNQYMNGVHAKDSNTVWGEALHTLQILQESLRTHNLNKTDVKAASKSESPVSVPSQSPRVSLQQSPVPVLSTQKVEQKPSAETNTIELSASERSPPAAEFCEEDRSNVPIVHSDTVCNSFSVSLPPSLGNYFDPRLIAHTCDWPAEQLEIRAHIASNEGLLLCGHLCAQVCAELKRDRSSVRIAEVQSTLIERRILFLKQQITELETQNKNFTSNHT